MLLPILSLVAWSGIALAAPRVKGPQVTPYGRPIAYQHQQQRSLPAPTYEIVPGSSDSDSILIKVDAKDFDQFVSQSGVKLSHSPKYDSSNSQDKSVSLPSNNNDALNAEFNVPLNPQPPTAQFTVPSILKPNIPSNTPYSNPSNNKLSVPSIPQASVPSRGSDFYVNVQGDGAGRQVAGQHLLMRTVINKASRKAPSKARLISVRHSSTPLSELLTSNYSTIRLHIVDTFRCEGRAYGYYADMDNDCQIFHVCMSYSSVFPDLYSNKPSDLKFSFICPNGTRFSQDVMVCVWEDEAIDCPQSQNLYHLNDKFFVKDNEGEGGP